MQLSDNNEFDRCISCTAENVFSDFYGMISYEEQSGLCIKKLFTIQILCSMIMRRGPQVRITLNLPETFIDEAMALTQSRTKTDIIKLALTNLIQKQKIQGLKKYYGKLNPDIDLEISRNRG